jgi:hypothetical protein
VFDSRENQAGISALVSNKFPAQWVLVAFTLVIEQLGREVNHSPPPNTQVMNMWIYTSMAHIPQGMALN